MNTSITDIDRGHVLLSSDPMSGRPRAHRQVEIVIPVYSEQRVLVPSVLWLHRHMREAWISISDNDRR